MLHNVRFDHRILRRTRDRRGRRREGSRRGFTIIEVIGVLTVIALLAAAVIPTVIRRIDQAAWTKETADLKTIADAYTQHILRNKVVPNQATWASSVGSYLSLPVNAVTNTPRTFPRVFLIDPNMMIGTNGGSNLATS